MDKPLELAPPEADILRAGTQPMSPALINTACRSGLVGRMHEMCIALHGAGLAAPQVGYPLQFFVFRFGDAILPVFNPRIVKARGEKLGVEGCFSLPSRHFDVRRPEIITAEWTCEDGSIRREKMSGWAARCFQHELDHLHGILIDKIGVSLDKQEVPE